MKNQIIIHGSGKQTRIALIENGELAQLFIEAPENQRTVGDIYLAEVHKVMAGIRAAFISMGTPKDAFLHFSDVGDNLENYIKMLNGDDAIDKAIAHNKELNKRYGGGPKESTDGMSAGVEKQMRAGDVLQNGQKLLVQIVKEPIGSKGPRVSTDITIAGRFVVLIPLGDYVAVSKRIRSFKERRRLRNVVSSKMPDGFGIIVRTVAQNQPDNVLIEDVEDVLQKWSSIISQVKSAKPPALLYRDLDMTESLIRDLFAKDYNQVLIDDPTIHKEVKTSVSKWAPEMVPNIKLYKGKEHIFDYMRISADVESVFSPRVKMPSGGYLIFEQTEAMYVVDVNSGRYAAKRQQEENSLKTNLEGAREIAKQLRLRDIGGIIVVDFIDLKDDINRKKVYDELKKEFRKDKAKTNVLAMSDFGLVQITRQRIRPSVVKSISKVCPMCGGTGELVSQNTIVADIEAWLSKFQHAYKKHGVDLYMNPFLRSFLTRGLISERLKWMFKFRMKISVFADETISMNDYRFTLPGSDVDITETVMQDRSLDLALKASEEELLRLTSESKMDRSKLDVFDKKNDRHTQKGSKYRDLDEDDYEDDDDEDDDDHDHDHNHNHDYKNQNYNRTSRNKQNEEFDVEVKPRKIISPKDKYFKKTDSDVSENEALATAPIVKTRVIEKSDKSTKVEAPKIVDEEIKAEKLNLRNAIDVAREYAELHQIEVKSVQSEEDDYDYSDENSDNHSDSDHFENSNSDENDEENDLNAEKSSEVIGVLVKSSIQFVETEDDDVSEVEIYKETIEVLEKKHVSDFEDSESDIKEETNSEETEEVEKVQETETESVETEVEEAEEKPKKKRGKKPIKVSKKATEAETPRQILQKGAKAKKVKDEEKAVELENQTTAQIISNVVSDLVEKKTPGRKSTKKAASAPKENEETKPVVDDEAKTKSSETAKIRVSTTKSARTKKKTSEEIDE